MKNKMIQVVVLTSLVLLTASCKKDTHNKNLTSASWKVSAGTIVYETIVTRVYTDGTDNTSNTQRETETFTASTYSKESYQLDTEVGSPDFFQRQVYTYNNEIIIVFEETGKYDISITQQLTSVMTESTGNPPATVTVTTLPTVIESSNYWFWSDNANSYASLDFNLGSLNNWIVESLTEDEMVLAKEITNTAITKPSSAETKTEITTTTAQITLVHP